MQFMFQLAQLFQRRHQLKVDDANDTDSADEGPLSILKADP